MSSLTVCIASCGRPSLGVTLASVASQIRPGDEILVDVNNDAPWGHAARNRMMWKAREDWLLFIDDDDWYVHGAFDAVRASVSRTTIPSRRPRMFRMRYRSGAELWAHRRVEIGNVSTQMFCVPNLWRGTRRLLSVTQLPEWGDRYEGDFDFIHGVCDLLGEPVWEEAIIAQYGRF